MLTSTFFQKVCPLVVFLRPCNFFQKFAPFSAFSRFWGLTSTFFKKSSSALFFLACSDCTNFFQKICALMAFSWSAVFTSTLFQKNCPFSSVALFLLGVLNFLQKLSLSWWWLFFLLCPSYFFKILLRWSVPF